MKDPFDITKQNYAKIAIKYSNRRSESEPSSKPHHIRRVNRSLETLQRRKVASIHLAERRVVDRVVGIHRRADEA